MFGGGIQEDAVENVERVAEYDNSGTQAPVEVLSPEESAREAREALEAAEEKESARQQALNTILDRIFPSTSPTSSHSSSSSPASNKEDLAVSWDDLLFTTDARERFLQKLDDKRGMSAQLDAACFHALARGMQVYM